MNFAQYLKNTGITVSAKGAAAINQTGSAPKLVLAYPVPELTPDGTCSISHTLANKPYDLRPILGVTTPAIKTKAEAKLTSLHRLLNAAQLVVKADWIGIYQATYNLNGKSVLVKLAYQGTPSRAEFPLTEEFAQLSNNTTVGLSGKAVIINDVATHRGPYYVCDGAVQSEACLPIFDTSGKKVVGIVDAESFSKHHFDETKIRQIANLCHTLTAYIPVNASWNNSKSLGITTYPAIER